MTNPENLGSVALVRANSSKQFIGKKADDVPPAWIDNMVKRLFDELNRQLIRAERASMHEPDARDAKGNFVDDVDKREKNARVLSRLQTQLDRLTRLETERAHLRATKEARTPQETRSAIRFKVLAILAEEETSSRSGGTQ
jgi:hypothetical protein